MLPPVPRGLDIDSIGSKLFESVFSSMSKSVRGVCGSNESQGSILLGILEGDKGILEGVEAVGNSVVDIAVDISVSDELVDNFCCTHLITISNTRATAGSG